MATIHNPIIRGFNPDPSIIRVGEDYYIATSTFEWFPGIQIHHSKDLVNWELIARPINRVSQLDMRGVPDSCGVWAPCLTYHEGTFYLVYSNTHSFQGVWKDTPNYLITTDDIRGDWSDPIFLSSMGFDGSLFHDTNGRKWYSSIHIDHRNNKFFGGIALQEYDEEKQKLIGEAKVIFPGSELGITEGPHLYQKDGYYYLITAEGGTEYGHAVTIARSKDIYGPYEVHPDNPLVTSSNDPDWKLQKTGHADIVQSPDGDWYITFLIGRPLTKHGRCTLGRESVIERLIWEEGEWPRLESGNKTPRLTFDVSWEVAGKKQSPNHLDQFDKEQLDINWQSLRVPIDDSWLKLDAKAGQLTLMGRQSLSSFHDQSLIARRVQSFHIEVVTCLSFHPATFQQMAGLVFYYNTCHFHYLHIMGDMDSNNAYLSILSCDKHDYSTPLTTPIALESTEKVYLKGVFKRESINFYFAMDNQNWREAGPTLDGSILSDDYVRDEENRYQPAFTGAFTGLCCQDLTGNYHPAHFHLFEYKEFDDEK